VGVRTEQCGVEAEKEIHKKARSRREQEIMDGCK